MRRRAETRWFTLLMAAVAIAAAAAVIWALASWAQGVVERTITGAAPAPLAREQGPLTASAQVDYVVDGDTLRLTTGDYVRLLGIDAPEAERQDGTPADCWAQEAATALTTITPPGTTITLTRDQTQDPTDRYGRTLAYVATEHVPDAGEQLLRNGDVRPYTFDDPVGRGLIYAATANQAQAENRGVWGCPVP